MKTFIKNLLVITMCAITLSGCNKGGKKESESSSPEHEHVAGEWFEEDGYHYHVCSVCGDKFDIELHTLNEIQGEEAGHEHGGTMHHFECNVCHKKFLDSKGMVALSHIDVSPTGHDKELTYHPAVPATCEAEGSKAYYSCSCGQLFEDEHGLIKLESVKKTPALGHVHYGIYHSDDNKHWFECQRCHEIIEEENHISDDEIHQDLNYTWHECTKCGHKLDIKAREISGCHHNRLMHYEKVNPTYSSAGHIEYYYCCDCHKCFYDEACAHEIENTQYGILDKRDDRYLSPLTSTFSILNNNLKDYFNAETDQEIIAALRNNSVRNYQAQKTVFWKDNHNDPYTIEVSNNKAFNNVKSYVSSLNAFTFEGTFTPGETIYYRVKDANDKLIVDDLSFKINDDYSLRPITVDGMHNFRDLGGWKAKDGHKVQYGKLYRGGALTGITPAGEKTFLNTLGIKTEIDLRRDGTKECDNVVNYQNCGMWMYTAIIPGYAVYTEDDAHIKRGFEEYSIASIKKAFEILADEDNYPVYYHCTAGADRTGTLSYLINGLLGVDLADLTRDFELTSFSAYGDRYRSGVTENNTFDDTGSFVNTSSLWCAFGLMNTVMNLYYGEEDKPIYYAIENYLKEVCEISDETIANVRLNLLGEEVDFSLDA